MYDRTFLIRLVKAKMPFGQYEGRYLTSLPVHYLEWFARQGFPSGQLGQQLATMHEIKINGLDDILKPIIRMHRNSGR
ncbi:DUF3820 family protein [Gracilimonas mengyeensis]|uniref:DUF3820 family protein n=1 Tax=Gracilimonas mengyeensis TaxID=1302730 RepID=A0A521CGC5_9BACT|nr:DUF3820 family protein [Gracilimonas mengyeensis]SMO58493.1 hypothetical protein SAMN06265219_105132 [Gracilimonas mengyeensis]